MGGVHGEGAWEDAHLPTSSPIAKMAPAGGVPLPGEASATQSAKRRISARLQPAPESVGSNVARRPLEPAESLSFFRRRRREPVASSSEPAAGSSLLRATVGATGVLASCDSAPLVS